MSSMLELPPALAEPSPAPAPAREPHLRLVAPAPLDFDEAARSITPRLQRYATRRLGDAHEAEELVQEALLRAYKHADQLQTEDDLIAWCTVVTGRLVIDRLRVRGRSVNVAEVPEGTRVGRDTADVVVARDEARMALDALDAMPSRQAAVLWAREVEGQGYDEIGLRFGMTEPAVRSILTRARKALRKEYAARGGTLPVAGLAALAPWVTGLRWADRLRSAATRLAAPAAIGAMALGLVGGALHSPFTGGSKAPVTSQAVVSQQVTATGIDRPNPALIRPANAAQGSFGAATAGGSATALPHGVNPLSRYHVSSTCAPSVTPIDLGAGGRDCADGEEGSTLIVGKPLPNNPTGLNQVAVEAPVDCAQLPSTTLVQCHPSKHTGAQS